MAKKNNNLPIKKVTDMGSGVRSMMDKIYTSTYMTTPKLGNDLVNLSKDIDATLDKITNTNISSIGMPNISKLYSRANLSDVQNDKDIINKIDELFTDTGLMDNVLSMYMQNKYLQELDDEIDTVCKYMPRLLEALDTRKDNVLSADHFSKDFLTIKNKSVQCNDDTFNDRINQLKEKYDVPEKVEEWYKTASKYGEVFVYIVPYEKALNKLLATKSQTRINTLKVESGQLIVEGFDNVIKNSTEEIKDINNFNLSIELCSSNVLESAVNEMTKAKSKLSYVTEAAVNNIGNISETKFDNTISDKLNVNGLSDDFKPNDGLININNKEKDILNEAFPGSIVKELERTKVIPIYIEDMCLGYYYIEFKDKQMDMVNFSNSFSDPLTNLKSGSRLQNVANDVAQDNMLRNISSKLSSFIDAKFINNNQDLRKEIYMILKHNDIFNNCNGSNDIKITFIPPDDMLHICFEKNKYTHRGVSDLEKALIPAKLYSCLYITNVLTILTRGQDKRVYYVKNQVDTNISKVLLNTINQIKKSNFGIRQIENINNVLNITGRFNDYVIPRSPSGESPVDFEVMQGQNVDVKTELMSILEEIAINSTDVPIELIQARQSIDYAIQLTMTNSKFLRKVYNRQAKYQRILSNFITKIYNSEFNTTFELDVTLPPPMFLNITNTNQLISNTKEYVETIVDFETAGMDDELFKSIYKRDLLEYHLGSHINLSLHKDIFERAKMKTEVIRKNEES